MRSATYAVLDPRHLVASQSGRPFAGAMENAQDLDAVRSHPIGNDIRCTRHSQLSCFRDAARSPQPGKAAQPANVV